MRAKPKRRHKLGFFFAPAEIDGESLDDLADICCIEDDQKRVQELKNAVQLALGQYLGLVEALDYGPRPANVVAALKKLKTPATMLIEMLEDLDSLTLLLLRQTEMDVVGQHGIKTFRGDLNGFLVAVELVLGQLRDTESRHSVTKAGLTTTVHELCRIYDRFADKNVPLTNFKGEPPVHPHRLLLDFVTKALEAAQIHAPSLDRLVRSYLPEESGT